MFCFCHDDVYAEYYIGTGGGGTGIPKLVRLLLIILLSIVRKVTRTVAQAGLLRKLTGMAHITRAFAHITKTG